MAAGPSYRQHAGDSTAERGRVAASRFGFIRRRRLRQDRFMARPVLRTQQIEPWPMTVEHLPLLHRLDSDPEVMRHLLGGVPGFVAAAGLD